MHLCVFGSGSSGNLAYIGDSSSCSLDRCGFLIDCGVTRILQRLRSFGISVDCIGGIVYTHRHSDHYRPPTYRALDSACIAQHVPFPVYPPVTSAPLPAISDHLSASFGHDLCLRSFSVDHDVPCYGYSVVLNDDSYLTWVPDTSSIGPECSSLLAESSVVCIDCNYDDYMISTKEYPSELASEDASLSGMIPGSNRYTDDLIYRIRSRGHLSTQRICDLITEYDHVETWVLTHLSDTFQHPSVIRHRLGACGLGGRRVLLSPRIGDGFVLDLSLDMLGG